MMSLRTCIITSLAIILLATSALFMLDRYGRNARVYRDVGAIDTPGVEKHLVNSAIDAYRIWKSNGFRGRTILFVADRWERLDKDDIQMDPPMSRRYPLQLYKIADLLEQTRLNERNFLFVAAVNGITRRIVAILPQQGFDEMKEMAHSAKNSRIGTDEIYVTHQGFPRWYTTGTAFKGEQEPVLLYISASYFRDAEPEDLFRQLTAAKLRTDCIILCLGKGDDKITKRESDRLARFASRIGMAVDTPVTERLNPSPESRP
jgi:hypothetical protein